MSGKLIFTSQIIFSLLLSGLTCGCLQRTITNSDVPSEKYLIAISGAVTQDKTLSVLAQIDLVTKQGYQPVRAGLVIKKPSYLRLELLPVIGTPDFFLAATPAAMSIFIPLEVSIIAESRQARISQNFCLGILILKIW